MCGKVRACADSHRGANEAGAHDRKAARTPPNATERRLFKTKKPRRAAPLPTSEGAQLPELGGPNRKRQSRTGERK